MLFNSHVFLFLFLPVTFVAYLALGNYVSRRMAVYWLVMCSLFFYGWWNPKYILLILSSAFFNYSLGLLLAKWRIRALLILGVCANLCLLGYYKYANFFIDNINALTSLEINFQHIILPLAISFFTFQQIA